MKGAIASVEIFAFAAAEEQEAEADPVLRPRRLTLVIDAPARTQDGKGWRCRVALADLRRPEWVEGRDSIEVLGLALARGREWFRALQEAGCRLTRDRAGQEPFEWSPF